VAATHDGERASIDATLPATTAAPSGERQVAANIDETGHLGLTSAGAQRASPGQRTWLETPRVTVVIPVVNEALNLPRVLPRIPPWVDRVLLIDGDSQDGTHEVVRELDPTIDLLIETPRGKGAALTAGFAATACDIIVMLDGDGSTDPAEIPAFVGALLAGADVVKGSRFLEGGGTADMSTFRRMGNWGFVMLSRLLFRSRYTDLCYGYMAFWSRVLPRLELNGDGFEIEAMLSLRALTAGFQVTEVASYEFRRPFGKSHLRAIPDGWRVLKTILREWMRFRSRTIGNRRPDELPVHEREVI
jgi:glycosyltransferase involved in cell wall biosynthesis